ncbi:MAG TPA: thrombospondin type 3 repeat-containing protein [Polyangia bacterium]
MRKPLAISLVLASAAPTGSIAVAAPAGTSCSLAAAESGCFVDEVLVVKGDETAPGPDGANVPLVNCMGTDCFIGQPAEYARMPGYERAVRKALELSKAKGIVYDQIVLFGADITVGTTGMIRPHGPLFFRTAGAMPMTKVNEVGGIGLPVTPRDPAKPYVGIIAAGTTKNLGSATDTAFGRTFGSAANGQYTGCQETFSTCFRDITTYFDALAQATGMLYGPYFNNYSRVPEAKTGVVALTPAVEGKPAAFGPVEGGPEVNVWNALLNTNGSLLGGNTWRDKGNGTWEIARPTAFQGVSAPFEGSQVLRFQPLDLYLLGFAPKDEAAPLKSFVKATPAAVYLPAGTSAFSASVGPGMGTRISGVTLRTTPEDVAPNDILTSVVAGVTASERMPAVNAAPQYIKQLWVVVTKPGASWDSQKVEIQNVAKARRYFNQYFYNLTAYRGRVHTTVEGDIDDSGYFEFGDKDDDKRDWAGEGVSNLNIPGPELIPNSGGRMLTVARLDVQGGGKLVFKDAAHKIRISGAKDVPLPSNFLTLRMRLPNNQGLGRLTAKVTLACDKGPIEYPVPGGDQATLIADGRFRNYTVALTSKPEFENAICTGISVTPLGDGSLDGVEIDYLKVGNASATNLADADKECNGSEKSDGWLALEDNCPTLYNPDQADGNSDGIGDACEDFDGDNVRNQCDNCPTVTNSSQRDANGNKQGDACDGSQSGDCFFSGATVAGTAAPTSATWWAGLGLFGLMLARALRKRRNRR